MRWGSRLPPPNSGRRRSPMCEIWNHSVGADGSKQDGAAPCQQHRFEWTDSRPKVTHWSALDQSRPLFRWDLADMASARARTFRVSEWPVARWHRRRPKRATWRRLTNSGCIGLITASASKAKTDVSGSKHRFRKTCTEAVLPERALDSAAVVYLARIPIRRINLSIAPLEKNRSIRVRADLCMNLPGCPQSP
jgi:hypothetical protein